MWGIPGQPARAPGPLAEAPDTVNLGIGPIRTGIFNITDIAIVAVLLAFASKPQSDTTS